MKCVECNGTGFQITVSGEEYRCPNCLGGGELETVMILRGYETIRVVVGEQVTPPVTSIEELLKARKY